MLERTVVVRFDGASKSYGNKPAVVDLSFDIMAGEIFAFLGPNGAGKTTTIKMMTGLLRPNKGGVCVCGKSMASEALDARRCVGYVPDRPMVYDKLTGREFLTFVGEIFGMPVDERERESARLIEIFELSEFVDQLAETYSHGMRQRLAFAGALLHRPKVLILDEPMVGLDPKSMRIVKDLLRTEAAKGLAVFMSTHTLAIAEEIADRIAIIQRGKLIRIGTLPELQAEFNGARTLEDFFLEVTREMSQ